MTPAAKALAAGAAALTLLGMGGGVAASARDATLRDLVHKQPGLRPGAVRGRGLVMTLGQVMGADMARATDNRLTPGDLDLHDKAARDAVWRGPTGVVVRWKNFRTGHSGQILARGPAESSPVGVCRPFEDVAAFSATDTFVRAARVCLGPDRVWRVD